MYIYLLFLLFLSGCVTYDEHGNEVIEQDTNNKIEWKLEKISPLPDYDEEELKIPVLYSGLPIDPPDQYHLPNHPGPGDQGRQPAGTAWAISNAVTYLYRNESPYRCSPAFIYNIINGNQNRGIELKEGLLLVQKVGCASFPLMPFNQNDHLTQPGPTAYKDAARHKIKGFARVEFTDFQQVRGMLLKGQPVIALMIVTENFLKHDEEIWTPEGSPAGLHGVFVTGYNSSDMTITIQNSAGKKWGKDGSTAIPFPWFIRLTKKAYVIF